MIKACLPSSSASAAAAAPLAIPPRPEAVPILTLPPATAPRASSADLRPGYYKVDTPTEAAAAPPPQHVHLGPSFKMEIEIDIPFRCADVWREIANPSGRQLGVPPNVVTEMSSSALELHCTRKVTVQNDDGSAGTVASTLVQLIEGSLVIWQVNEQVNVPIVLTKPASTSIELSELPGKTRISLGYQFSGIRSTEASMAGATEAAIIERLKAGVSGSSGTWHDDMAARGYTPMGPSDTNHGTGGTQGDDPELQA